MKLLCDMEKYTEPTAGVHYVKVYLQRSHKPEIWKRANKYDKKMSDRKPLIVSKKL